MQDFPQTLPGVVCCLPPVEVGVPLRVLPQVVQLAPVRVLVPLPDGGLGLLPLVPQVDPLRQPVPLSPHRVASRNIKGKAKALLSTLLYCILMVVPDYDPWKNGKEVPK